MQFQHNSITLTRQLETLKLEEKKKEKNDLILQVKNIIIEITKKTKMQTRKLY